MPAKTPLEMLIAIRRANQVVQAQAADFFGLSGASRRITYGAWERGENPPPLTQRKKFIEYLLHQLNLRADLPRFRELCDALFRKWGWEIVSEEELNALIKPVVLTNWPKNEFLKIGTLQIEWIVLAHHNYERSDIRCFHENKLVNLPPDLNGLLRAYEIDLQDRSNKGETRLPFNGQLYKLQAFDVGAREVKNDDEVPKLILNFCNTDYFTQVVTDLNYGNPIRDKYVRSTNITESPVPEFSTILGVNVSVMTRDRYLIVTERSRQAHIAGGSFHTSIAENLLRPQDSGFNAAPDVFKAALRAANEELGLTSIQLNDLHITTFGVHPKLCQYSLLGHCEIKETKDEVEIIRALGQHKDRWENRRLHFVPFTPEAVAQFVFNTQEEWFSIGLATVIMSLFSGGYSRERIIKAFS